ncbi:MAG: alpha-1,4-glucan--maltose-1-phosphate maltosyltransferase [Dehalococcoidia bacterium SG8_51_3]|nr:MAG: alpha-1,4-glucan--maltose-1-phosphate maltosyltransferase [Dehalococcoidia bacterium SG8_51_3]
MPIAEGKSRVIIEGIQPEIDGGRFPIKRVVGEDVAVEADIFADGHESLSAYLLHRGEDEPDWTETLMKFLGNDRWRGSFAVEKVGLYRYTVIAWVDKFKSWRQDLSKRVEARQKDIEVNLLVGADIIAGAQSKASRRDSKLIAEWADTLRSKQVTQKEKMRLALSDTVGRTMERCADRRFVVTYPEELVVTVDREKARFSSWYEMFPRSCAPKPNHHGTFRDCEARLPYIAEMGFDVLYLPPIHPIGHTNRKGKNNALTAAPDDPGTPWAIGAEEGGHKAIHQKLGTMKDFQRLVHKARDYGIEVALDMAFQCSPDHPYVKEHPEWFQWRPDGTIQYAENPPKKYQDIYPLDFESENWQGLWEELKSVILFWIENGVRIFRVDNPHTKPFAFWEWLIGGIKADHPDVIFLAEAFTRPKIMYQLAKLGFSQSYTYFTWRNAKWELEQYFTELTQTPVREFYCPNLWPNTPDILNDYLRDGGRPAFIARLVLAATLGANYGIYGPAFELCENRRKDTISEEYLDSEKYEIKHWAIERKNSLKDIISLVNKARRENPALQSNRSLRFHAVDNDQLICYSKCTPDGSNVMLVVVNLDYRYKQSGWVTLSLDELGIAHDRPYRIHDVLDGATYTWKGPRNYVELNPVKLSAHIFQVEKQRQRK